MLRLKLQYVGHLMWRTDSLEKTLMLGKTEVGEEGGDRGWDGWMASPTQWTWVWVNSRSWWWIGRPACCSSWGHKGSDTTEQLNWTELSGSSNKESVCSVGDLGSIPGLGRSPREGHGNPLQYSHLENRRRQRSLAGYSPRGCKESDLTSWLSTHTHQLYSQFCVPRAFEKQGYILQFGGTPRLYGVLWD